MIALVLSLLAAMGAPLPGVTPGALCTTADRYFDGRRYPEQVPHCRRHVSSSMKSAVFRAYGLAPAVRYLYVIDHLIPLDIGGSNARANLWPQLATEAAAKDREEERLYRALAAGKIMQAAAVESMLHWGTP